MEMLPRIDIILGGFHELLSICRGVQYQKVWKTL